MVVLCEGNREGPGSDEREEDMSAAEVKPLVVLPDNSYQPNKQELGVDMRIDASFEEVTQAVLTPVDIRTVKPPRKRRRKR